MLLLNRKLIFVIALLIYFGSVSLKKCHRWQNLMDDVRTTLGNLHQTSTNAGKRFYVKDFDVKVKVLFHFNNYLMKVVTVEREAADISEQKIVELIDGSMDFKKILTHQKQIKIFRILERVIKAWSMASGVP